MGRHREFNKKIINGYVLVYKPEHPNSMTSEKYKGYIYEHVLVASLMLGKPLNNDEFEQVHHLNFNRQDNRPKNLIVLSKGMHTRLHNWIDDYNLQQLIMENSSEGHHVHKCLNCGEYHLEDKKFCNVECRNEYRLKNLPSKEELEVMLDDEMTQKEIGERYGVSRSNISKLVKEFGLR